ncbi:serine protease pepA [Mycobacterium tuberculosis CCDC5079]|nr:serine protease pepA [Mycobacterium tuberculosis CCDC5079]
MGGVAVGEPVVAMGNSGGQGGTPRAVPGRVVALGQTVQASDSLTGAEETLNGLIQFDAAIQPGDSGGPVVNGLGQVVGMNTAASDNFQLSQGGQDSPFRSGRRWRSRARSDRVGGHPPFISGLPPSSAWVLSTTTATAHESNAWSGALRRQVSASPPAT